MKQRAFLILLAAVLGGCAQLPRTLPASGRQTADSHPARPVSGRTPTWPSAAWWTVAGSRPLDRLMNTALRGNPTLTVASARVLAAHAIVLSAQAHGNLHLGAAATMTHAYFSQQGLHATANGTTVLYTEIDPLVAHYHLALWGRTRDRIRAALGALRAARAERTETRLLLATRIVVHYFALSGDRARYHDLVQQNRLAHHLLQLTQTRLRLGLAGAQAVYRQQEACAATHEALLSLAAAVRIERHMLAALAGRDPAFGAGIAVTPLPRVIAPRVPDDLSLALVTHRPDIAAARDAVAAAAARVGAARAAFYPEVDIALFAGWNSIHLADLLDPANLARAIGPVVTLPIFEGGALRARLRKETALYRLASAHYQHTVLDAARAVANRLTHLTEMRRTVNRQRRALRAARHLADLTQSAYEAGINDRLAVLSAQIGALEAHERLLILETHKAQAWALFMSALGGGYCEDHSS